MTSVPHWVSRYAPLLLMGMNVEAFSLPSGANVNTTQLPAQYLYAHPKCTRSNTKGRVGDVGGQKTLRTYWKNYFEKTDTLIWVVDSTDAARLLDCRDELKKLLIEEVQHNETSTR
jgi:hypothetical protein